MNAIGDKKLLNRIALITGAGSGMGLETAKLFAREGAKVAMTDIDRGPLEEAAQAIRAEGGEALAFTADVRDEHQVRETVAEILARYGQIDILINSAGLGIFKTITDMSAEEFSHMTDVNLKGVFLCTQAVIPAMRERKQGCIMHIGSMAGVVPGSATAFGYNATKWALVGMTRCMAIELRPDNIRVTLLNPGTTDTHFRPGAGVHPDWMQAEDVAQTCLYVATLNPAVSVHELTFSVTAHGW
jgi:NAD(P)-dependent dehydrogenase (short-subunit alcohol dehydrogenase family)